MQVFTLGYQGLDLEVYTDTLLSAGVGLLIDVRETAWSYNRRYIKGVLSRTMAAADIEYLHLKECGNPSSNRKTATSVSECLRRYRTHLRENSDCLITLLDYIRVAADGGRPACLTCYEREPHECHRSILLELISEVHPSIQITHLHGDTDIKTDGALSLSSGATAQL